MKKHLAVLSLILVAVASIQTASASTLPSSVSPDEVEVIQQSDAQDLQRVRVRDVKAYYTENFKPEQTCMDEYLARHRQLVTQLILSPLTLAGFGGFGLVGGTYAGVAYGAATGANNGWGGLVDAIVGLELGTIAGVASGTFIVTEDIVRLARTDRMLKIIYDALHGGGLYLAKFRAKYAKKLPEMNENELAQKIVDADESGALCDGSMRKLNFLQRKGALKNKIVDQSQLAHFLGR